MSRAALLGQYFNELCPDFRFESWTSSDRMLSAATQQFLSDSSGKDPNLQGRYLAEAIYLDSLKPHQLEDSIERYIKRYVTQNFGDDDAKVTAIDRLCRDASASRGNNNSQQLGELLISQCGAAPGIDVKARLPLQHMKNVQMSTRYGDVVFLPSSAEVIVIGDTHGDVTSTRQIISEIVSSRALERGAYVVFLGDYTNNGVKSWQNLVEILCFKQKYPESVVLLSGNHEFKESYLTALNEYLHVHWERFTKAQLPAHLQDRLPQHDNHYSHMRLELVRCFGYEEGERIYSLCGQWGLGLPYICISGNLMISHSLGKLAGSDLQLPELLYAKQHDLNNIRQLGSEVCNSRKASLHSALINSRDISAQLLGEFNGVLDVDQFVVGHCHYRSGDTRRLGKNTVTTIVSSAPVSPDAGHFMYHQMKVDRDNERLAESLGPEDAFAGYLSFAPKHGKRMMSVSTLDLETEL